MTQVRKPYPSDVSDEEWSLVVPYLVLMREDAEQRRHDLRELFNGLRYVIAWRAMPNDLQQSRRWMEAGCFEVLASDLRAVLRMASGRKVEPTATILDSRTLRSTSESGPRAGYDGAKRKKGSKLHMAVDTFGQLLALHVTPANRDDRAELGRLAAAIQEVTDVAYVDQGYTGEKPAEAARAHGIALGDVCLIAADAVQRFGKHDSEFAALRVLQKRLDAGPQDHAGSGDACVFVSADDLPLFAFGVLATDAELIFD